MFFTVNVTLPAGGPLSLAVRTLNSFSVTPTASFEVTAPAVSAPTETASREREGEAEDQLPHLI